MLHFFFDLLYSMVMKALIPNKDTLFFLSKLQKEILKKTRCNPIYPLYCFQNEFPETISSFTILSPAAEDYAFNLKLKEEKKIEKEKQKAKKIAKDEKRRQAEAEMKAKRENSKI